MGKFRYDDALMFNQGSVTVNPDPNYAGQDQQGGEAITSKKYNNLFFYTGTKSVVFKKDVPGASVSFRYQSSISQIRRRNFEVKDTELKPFQYLRLMDQTVSCLIFNLVKLLCLP